MQYAQLVWDCVCGVCVLLMFISDTTGLHLDCNEVWHCERESTVDAAQNAFESYVICVNNSVKWSAVDHFSLKV